MKKKRRRRKSGWLSDRRKRRLIKRAKSGVQAVLYYLPAVCKWIFKIAVVCLVAFVAVWFFGQQVSTVGDSMRPVLRNGDVVLVNRIVYNASRPKRGDIIVFKPKGNENSHYYIKRIIGLPGETVEIIEGSVYINSEKLSEEYTTTGISDVGVLTEKITLASDEYFVLGDDRENSEDSRNADVGNVKREYIYGKVWFVLSPKANFGFIKE